MKCFHCGKVGNQPLCDSCKTNEILDKVFNDIRFYKPETCSNPYLAEYAESLDEKYAERQVIPEILKEFSFEVSDFYYCQYFRICRDDRFEDAATAYLQTHEIMDLRTQNVLYDLLENYLPNEFIKPKKWCESIAETDGLCCELYAVAAKYFAMIGEYDLSDRIADKCFALCEDENRRVFLFYSPENMMIRLNKQKSDTHRYRTKKPYWPATEERRRIISMFYDERGISYPRVESKPSKIPESDFVPIDEYWGEEVASYCAFWCSEAFSLSPAKSIYQIGAAKICDGVVTDTFEMLIRPWDSGASGRKTAAKESGIPLELIEAADDVDLVMPKFFAFVDEDVLISTGALGNQAKLISRAARYAGMKEIKNKFYDILDFAADVSDDFDLANNTREYLLSHFNITEGKIALEKALINKRLYDALQNYGE